MVGLYCLIAMSETAYHCDTHNCVVYELPCPHCGADDHESGVRVE
jgi:hypothetical protein